MDRNEEWMLLNYGSRGRRGITPKVMLDSEGEWYASYDKGKTWIDLECNGKGQPGEKGEPGENGKVVDVFVDGASVVDSEGKAYIDLPEVQEYEAGTNITFTSEGDVIKINATVPDITIGKDLTVTLALGGYAVGDTIAANTKVQDILEKILAYETPVPPVTNLVWYGVSADAPTGITAAFNSEVISSGAASVTHNFVTNKQRVCVATPKSLGDIQYIYQNGLPFNLRSTYTRIECSKDSVDYYMYYSDITIDKSGSSFEFKW